MKRDQMKIHFIVNLSTREGVHAKVKGKGKECMHPYQLVTLFLCLLLANYLIQRILYQWFHDMMVVKMRMNVRIRMRMRMRVNVRDKISMLVRIWVENSIKWRNKNRQSDLKQNWSNDLYVNQDSFSFSARGRRLSKRHGIQSGLLICD